MAKILDLDPATYPRHPIHGENRCWAETNCYSDVMIELLHGMGFEPIAALPFTFAIDFDVDQWTFFKFPHEDIATLYALGIHELAPWRSLAEHIEAHVSAGRPILVELDSFYLPDTIGTAYQLAHVKSTVAVNAIDREAGFMGYFHNQGYHHVEGEDFHNILQTRGLVHPRMMPPYIEFIKPIPRSQPLRGRALLDASLDILKKRLATRPESNPFAAFQVQFQKDMDWLIHADTHDFHNYSFVTLRQYGACFELSRTYLQWLAEQGIDGLVPAIEAFDQISQTTKTLQFQLARAMLRRRPLKLDDLPAMADQWECGIQTLLNHPGL